MAEQKPHRLFTDFPDRGNVTVSTGELPTRYVVRDGFGIVFCGTADLGAVTAATAEQGVQPVRTRSGKALMGIIACDFREASHGAHHELQVFALVSPDGDVVVNDHPLALLAKISDLGNLGTLCLHLWNNTSEVVAFNNEYLGLNAQLCLSSFEIGGGRIAFDIWDAENQPILSADVAETRGNPVMPLLSLVRQIGFRTVMQIGRQPYFEGAVVNMRSRIMPENRKASTFTAPDRSPIAWFREGRDQLTFSTPALQKYGFQPQCMQQLSPFRFVYLHPDDPGRG